MEMTLDQGPVLLRVADGVAHVQLNRPEASNGIDMALLRSLHEALMRCHADRRVRALLLTGAGRNFCGGGDVKEFAARGERLPEYLREATARLGDCARALVHLPAPVIALVQGHAAGGGGIGLICAADIVIAARTARFLSGATRVGMAPDGGSTAVLSRLIGHRRALEFVLLNRTLSAQEALELGLITRVVEDALLLEVGEALARELADGPTLALAESKRLLWDGLARDLDQALADEGRTVARLSASHDAREGLAAVIERRPARYANR